MRNRLLPCQKPHCFRPMNNLLSAAIFFIGVGISALIHYKYVYQNVTGSLLIVQFAATTLGIFAVSGVLLTSFADLWCLRLTLALAAAAGNVIGTRRARKLVSNR